MREDRSGSELRLLFVFLFFAFCLVSLVENKKDRSTIHVPVESPV